MNDKWTCHNGEIIHQVSLAKLWHRNGNRAVTTFTGERLPWTIWKSTSGSEVILGVLDGPTTLYLRKAQKQTGTGLKEIARIAAGDRPSNDTPSDDERAFEYVSSKRAPSKVLLRHAASGRYLYTDRKGKLHFTDQEALADDWLIEI